MDANALICLLWDTAHNLRILSEGKASKNRVLAILLRHDNITQRELLRIVQVSAPTLSEVLTKLEGAGYVKRVVCEEDRRSVRVFLTPEGLDAAWEANSTREENFTTILSALNEDEYKELTRLLEKLNKDWAARYDGCTPCRHPQPISRTSQD